MTKQPKPVDRAEYAHSCGEVMESSPSELSDGHKLEFGRSVFVMLYLLWCKIALV